jgi:hypothetical protein
METRMNTYQEQQTFFRANWPGLKAALEQGGAQAGIAFISGFADALERRVLFVFARQGMNGRDDAFEGGVENPSLDALIEVADAGIAELLAQAEAEPDLELRSKRFDSANVISYNIGADLADCWGDSFNRTREHFLRGLQAGEDCIKWRTELQKPPAPFSMAYWLRGMHRLSMGDGEGGKADFGESLRYAEQDAAEDKLPSALSPEAGFSVILAHGYLAIAEIVCGDEGADEHYQAALDCFKQQQAGDDAEKAEDAAFGITQLEYVWKRYAAGADSTSA